MMRSTGLTCLAVAAAMLGGCTPPPARPTPAANRMLDGCADQLHELCGQLLLYYLSHQSLPPTLEPLQQAAGGPLSLTCPTSGLPYVYRPEGVVYPGQPGRLILFDAGASHGGMRWAVRADASSGPAFTLRVVLLPDAPVFNAPPPPPVKGGTQQTQPADTAQPGERPQPSQPSPQL